MVSKLQSVYLCVVFCNRNSHLFHCHVFTNISCHTKPQPISRNTRSTLSPIATTDTNLAIEVSSATAVLADHVTMAIGTATTIGADVSLATTALNERTTAVTMATTSLNTTAAITTVIEHTTATTTTTTAGRGGGQRPWFVRQLPSRVEILEGSQFACRAKVGRGGCKPWFVKPLPAKFEIEQGESIESKCFIGDAFQEEGVAEKQQMELPKMKKLEGQLRPLFKPLHGFYLFFSLVLVLHTLLLG